MLVKSMGEAQGRCPRAEVGKEPQGSSTLEWGGGGRSLGEASGWPVDRRPWSGHSSGRLKHFSLLPRKVNPHHLLNSNLILP